MKNYVFNNGDITLQTNDIVKVGDILKALNMSKMGKDGKPTLCTIKVQNVIERVKDLFYQGTCEIIQVQASSNILTYNLYYVDDLQANDLLQTSTIHFMKQHGYALFFQSSGYRDATNGESVSLSGQLTLLKHIINYYVKEDTKNNRISPRFRGTHEDFIKYLQDNKLEEVFNKYIEMIKLNRAK